MGLWPFSSSSQTSTNQSRGESQDATPSDKAALPTQSQPSLVSREEQADRDLESFISEIESSTNFTPSKYQSETLPSLPTSTTTTTSPTTTTQTSPSDQNTPLDITPTALLPRTMSCRQAFDQAFYCQSLGGKFNDIYRYGSLQSCTEQWNAFWFCMRIRTLPGTEQEEKVKEYYRGRDEKRKKEWGSSEEVWDIRSKPVERAFWRDPDRVGG